MKDLAIAQLYSQTGCSLARDFAMLLRNIAKLIGKLLQELATSHGRLSKQNPVTAIRLSNDVSNNTAIFRRQIC